MHICFCFASGGLGIPLTYPGTETLEAVKLARSLSGGNWISLTVTALDISFPSQFRSHMYSIYKLLRDCAFVTLNWQMIAYLYIFMPWFKFSLTSYCWQSLRGNLSIVFIYLKLLLNQHLHCLFRLKWLKEMYLCARIQSLYVSKQLCISWLVFELLEWRIWESFFKSPF